MKMTCDGCEDLIKRVKTLESCMCRINKAMKDLIDNDGVEHEGQIGKECMGQPPDFQPDSE